MSANTGSALPIKRESLAPFRKRATDLLTSIVYEPSKDLTTMRAEAAPTPQDKVRLLDSRMGSSSSRSVSAFAIAKKVSGGDELLDEDVTAVLNIVRTGLQVGLYLGSQYEQFSGLLTLRNRGVISDAEKAEQSTKNATQAAVTAYTAARYILWRLASYKTEEVSGMHADFAGLPEPIPLVNFNRALSGVLFHWGSYLEEAQTGLAFAKVTQLYFTAVIDEIKRRSGELKYTEAFTSQIYVLEDSSFTITGFAGDLPGEATVVEFKRTELTEVVGNQEAKRLALRLSQFVMAYDFDAKKNPLMEIGAFPWITIFQGQAGTGKSMLLRVMQTMVSDYCKALGIPFRLHPIPNDMISSLQGESAVKYERWWSVLQNPKEIILAPVDDAEAVYLDRRSHSSSEGSKLIVMAHLRLTEGSTALIRGNVLQPHATNNADMIDPPVFSRYMARVRVPGAQTRNDFVDQMKMWGDGVNKLRTGKPIIDLEFPHDYRFLSDQGIIPLDEQDERKKHGLVEFKNKELAQIWDGVKAKNLSASSYDLYATLFSLLHQKYEQFTSRDVRNITTNMMARLFGFDFPPQWLEDRDTFIGRGYDEKKQMILGHAIELQGGLSVSQVLFEEVVHYVETTIEMLDSGRQYRIRQMADEIAERREAMSLAQ